MSHVLYLHKPSTFVLLVILFGASYLKIGKVFLHKAIDLADREAASFAVFQSHCNQTAEGKKEKIKSLLQLKADEVKYTTQQFSHKSKRLCADL